MSFLESWALFRDAYLAGWLIAVLLGMIGVVVVARDQIFIGAAVSQASMFGLAFGMAGGSWLGAAPESFLGSDAFPSAVAVAFAVAAAIATSPGGRPGRETHEAITGWVFLTGGAGSVLLLVHSPHGLEEIHRLAASSLIGATGADVAVFAVLAAATAAALVTGRRTALVMAIDPSMGPAVGIRTGLVSLLGSAWLGLSVALSIKAAGMLYAFGLLVLPALVAKNICREVGPMFWTAPAAALAAGVPGFVLANHWDLPPAQVVVAILALALPVGWALRRR